LLVGQQFPSPASVASGSTAALAIVLVVSNFAQAWDPFGHRRAPEPLASLAAVVSHLGITNTYGFFGVMNTRRPEIVIEGSRDGHRWLPYAFRYKPGDPHRCPTWNIPHQQRLDWSMWFAAGKSAFGSPWLGTLMHRLLEGSPEVLGLLAHNPFPDHPPKYVCALLYRYRFTTPAERTASGDCWTRELLRPYTPPIGLDNWTQP
jgi:hypothetical protein